jgi:predicted oxidoreductase
MNQSSLSPLGFGCASVMGKVSRTDSLRAMAVAFDHGITHFDVARSYGFGRAESVLGAFASDKRAKVTITTKFGIVPPALTWKHRLAMPVMRQLSRLAPSLQKHARAKSASLLAQQRFDLAYAQQCLARSLTELRTDYLDIYLLHEPPPLAEDELSALYAFLDDQVSTGVIRAWGLAYRTAADLQRLPAGRSSVCQVEGNAMTLPALSSSWPDPRQRLVTRPFGGGAMVASARRDAAVQEGRSDDAVMDALGLAHALAGPGGSVVCAMFSERHIRDNAARMQRLQSDQSLQEQYRRMLASAS